jgi:hypothetical protein
MVMFIHNLHMLPTRDLMRAPPLMTQLSYNLWG